MTDTTDTTRVATARPWLDASLPVDERVQLLLDEMTIEEKAGLFFHTMIAIGDLDETNPVFGTPSAREFVEGKRMTHFNLLGAAPTGREIAAWQNELQRLAASTRLGIPVTLSTDPRHSFSENPGASILAGPFSQWPETLGLAATRDAELVQRFGDIARQEYTAVGLRVALHPQVDLATEPRWARQTATFGEDAELSGILGAAYIRGFQGEAFGPGSVSTMTKHFPGGGPQKDGEDPHFPYGREQVYPGGEFELHLAPFEDALAAGTRQMMPYYGMPVGTEYEEVGFGFNRSVITGLLRERFGFDGLVCTDWGLINDAEIFGQPFPARAWGVEHLTPKERMRKVLDAGVDQFGGEDCPELLVELVAEGAISQERVDVSARRILREKFELGLFENPFVDEDAADEIVGRAEFRAAGEAAQRASITVLVNDGALPFPTGRRLYVEGVDREVAAAYGEVVDAPEDADLAVVRLQAPFDVRETMFENFFHAGSLEFPEEILDRVRAIAAAVPTVVDVLADRPPILGPIVDVAAAVTLNWGASGAALLDVLSGAVPARGRLPFDLPSSMAAVEASRPDVPFDTSEPLFRFGHGLVM
ncbi:glycoside hydrolase family 3 protein [Microbacterium sp. H83]|uniref:glycoside hydrolase family 3 protein n=1 Tax=Microbacterium sp. H83 TaxID=1827324 RepID=UPI0007F4B0A5|nr:glycoside hydrolase family 3 N-terminal domain-containing protein [Microbacterium sp. H83]OAN36507.1 beta-glucosidase [Microbacterium sp. H83]